MRGEFGRFDKGHDVPSEWSKKISEANKGKHFSPETEYKAGVDRLDKRKITDDKLIYYYQSKNYSTKKIRELTGLNKTTITRRLKRLGFKIKRNINFVKGHTKRITHGFYYRIKCYKEKNKECKICGWNISIDIHHIIPLSDNGTNKEENLISLCPNHHRMVHRGLIDLEDLKKMKQEGD